MDNKATQAIYYFVSFQIIFLLVYSVFQQILNELSALCQVYAKC